MNRRKANGVSAQIKVIIMSFGTTKMVRTFKVGVHNFEVIEAVVKQNPVKGSAYLNLKSCVCIDAKGADKGRTVEDQLLPFLFGLNFGPNEKKGGETIRDTYFFLVSVCGLDYLDFNDEEMDPAEALSKAYETLIENADIISSDIVGKTFKARTLNGVDMEGAECSNLAKGSFSSMVSASATKSAKVDNGKAGKSEAVKAMGKVEVDEEDDF